MNAQEIFDTVAKHLATQGRRSGDSRTCFYRTADGLKCAVGCLIRDDEYTPEMDQTAKTLNGQNLGTSVESLVQRGLLPERLLPFEDLLSDLQEVHDGEEHPRDALRRKANYHDLSPAILDTLTFPEVWK